MTIRLGTAEKGGTFYTQGQALAALLWPSMGEVEVLSTPTASVGNARRLDAGEIDFGFMAANWIGRARDGSPPFTAPVDIAMVAPMNAGPLFFVTRRESSLRSIRDLAGKRVAVGAETSGMTQHTHVILGLAGIGFDDFEPVYLDFAAGADALAAGHVDAQFQCPIPNRVMTDLSRRADIRVLDVPDDLLAHILANVPHYRPAVIRAGALRGVDNDTSQVGVLNVLATHADRPEELVREVTAAIAGGAGTLAEANVLFQGMADLFEPLRREGAAALEPGGVALHPGALRAYREAGYLA